MNILNKIKSFPSKITDRYFHTISNDVLEFNNLPIDEYHKALALSRSSLREFEKSPKKFEHKYILGLAKFSETAATNTGKGAHFYFESKEEFNLNCAVGPEVSKNSKEWKEFAKTNLDKLLFKPSEAAGIIGMAEAIDKSVEAQKYLSKPINNEVSYYWVENEILLKCRPDAITKDYKYVIDYKTTIDADPKKFMYSGMDYANHISVAMTMNGIEAVTGIRPLAYIFVVVEKSPPYDVAIYRADEDMILYGELIYRTALPRFKKSIITNTWEGMDTETRFTSIPGHSRKHMDHLLENGTKNAG